MSSTFECQVRDNLQDIARRLRSLELTQNKSAVKEKSGNFTAGSVLFAGSPGQINEDNANLFWDDTNDLLRIGAATTQRNGRALTVTDTETSGGTQLSGAVIEELFSPGATQVTVAKVGAFIISMLEGTGGTSAGGSIQGAAIEAHHKQTSGTMSGSLVAVNTGVRVTAAGSAGDAIGLRSVPILSSSGSITSWYHFYGASPSLTSSGTITTAYGLYLQKQKVTGVTTGYGIYQVDAADLNFFGGATTLDSGFTSNAAGAVTVTDTATGAAASVLLLGHNSSNTPAANFAADMYFRLKSSTTNDTITALLRSSWVVATHLSRTSIFQIYAYDSAAAREGLRIQSSGTASMIGFLGANAVVRQNITGVLTAATLAQLTTVVSNILTGLTNLGLTTNSTT